MDKLRREKEKATNYKIIAFIMIGISVICLVSRLFFITIFMFAMAMIMLFISSKIKSKVMKHYKNDYIKPLLDKYFDDTIFVVEEGLSEDEVKKSALFPMGNRYHSNDLVKGNYKGIPFRMSDVVIKQVTSNGKTTTTTEYFRGKWIIAKFEKSIEGYVKVRERDFFGGDGTSIFSNTKKIETESIEFNKLFSIRTVNEVEAFYILTPHFMQRLISIENQIEGDIGFAFFNNEIHIALYTQSDQFEIGFMDQINEDLIRSHEEQIKIITSLFESLYENRGLFKEMEK